ncbi:MAG: Ig-like domain-containing protein [Clostridiales Family XIII bacterium]|nr:Ig-like domain-containing protein [Clostridiales Family XIII bacterium]
MNEGNENSRLDDRKTRWFRGRAVRVFALTAALIATLVIAPEYSLLHPLQAHAAPAFMATAGKPSLSTIYVTKGTSIMIKGRYLAKGDKVKSYTSSKKSVATISEKGKLKARKAGKTTVTLKTKKGKKDTIKVVVVQKAVPAKSVTITKSKSINVKQVARLTVKTKPTKSTSTVRWSSSDKSIATVNAAGYITGKKVGKVTITMKTSSGKKATCKLTVKDPVTISAKSASVRVDRPGRLKLTATAPSGIIIWSSSDESIATVKDGVVIPGKVGAVDIIATSKASGTTAKCRVTVVPHIAAEGISVSPSEKAIKSGKTTTLKATLVSSVDGQESNDDITWSSSNTKVAKVSDTGVVTGANYGVAKITVAAESGPTAVAEITVSTVKANDSKVVVTPGMKYKTRFTFYGSSKGVTYSSSNKSIATVTSSGEVQANLRDKKTGKAKEGTVTITAKVKSGEKATMKVVVRDEPTIVDVSKWQGNIDWATASKSIDLAILRVIYGTDVSIEGKYTSYSNSCKKYDVPFGVYAYVRYKSKSAAENEATKFYNQAVSGGREPLFFVVDAEDSYITRANTEAYIAKLRSLAKEDGIERLKIGVYVGHHLYTKMNLNLVTDLDNAKTPDFVWIPRYNTNIGARTSTMSEPDYPCDIWQYSSTGGIPGISGNVDMNTLTDTDGDWLTEKSTFDFKWLIAGSEAK